MLIPKVKDLQVSSLMANDLIHKAVGWMLREMGKKSPEALEEYLSLNHGKMSRTTLRYAIEKLPEPERQRWMRM